MITDAITSYIHWRGAFQDAMDPRFYNIEYLDWLVANDRAKFFCAHDAALVAEIRMFPSGRCAAHFLVAAGNLETLKDELAGRVEAWGKANGCDFALIESRPGWRREMKDSGYEPFQESIVKEL